MGFVIAIILVAAALVVGRRMVNTDGPQPSILKAIVVPLIMLGLIFGGVAGLVFAFTWATRGWFR